MAPATLTTVPTFTINAENVTPGLVLDFEGYEAETPIGFVPVHEAEVTIVERPDGLGPLGFWVRPEDEDVEVYIIADLHHYTIVG